MLVCIQIKCPFAKFRLLLLTIDRNNSWWSYRKFSSFLCVNYSFEFHVFFKDHWSIWISYYEEKFPSIKTANESMKVSMRLFLSLLLLPREYRWVKLYWIIVVVDADDEYVWLVGAISITVLFGEVDWVVVCVVRSVVGWRSIDAFILDTINGMNEDTRVYTPG